MKKLVTLCVGAALLLSATLGVASQARAQDQTAQPAAGAASGPFADVPADHWAYLSLSPGLFAPASSPHLGTWIDPFIAKPPTASFNYRFSPRLGLSADGSYQAGETAPIPMNGGVSAMRGPLSDTDRGLTRYSLGLNYGLTRQYKVDLGYEYDEWNLNNYIANSLSATSSKPTEQYITFGVSHPINKNASLKFLYQILQYNGGSTNSDSVAGSPAGPSASEHGSVAITQFSLKF